ncbi:MAG TPA: hypothetical protein VF794_29015 [Archangium sp.]|jgi:hypothetical protein|uniref:hypothetical protein n=1 Tax=Archangium sp. TaxID=1872627 RepID=UPI002ED779C7
MRHVRPSLFLLPLLVVGCRYPEDPVFAYGRALNPDGSPLAGATLSVERAPPPVINYGEEQEEEQPPTFSPYATFTTQANGDFTLQFLTGDVEQWASDYQYTQYNFRVSLPLREDGQGTFVSFAFSGDMELPPLQHWDARFTVADGPRGPSLSFTPVPPAAELPPSGKPTTVMFTEQGEDVTLQVPTTTPEPIVQLFSGGERLWLQSRVSAPWVPGPYVLEDFTSPEAQLRAVSLGQWTFSPLGSTGSHVFFRQEWRTARLPLSAGVSRPVSRGASCEAAPPGPCPWTDGQLTPVAFTDTEGQQEIVPSLIVTLAEPTLLRRAVIRELEYNPGFDGVERVLLEGSADGEHWFPLANSLLRDRSRREAILDSMSAGFADDSAWDSPFDGKLELYDRAPVFLDLPLETPEPVRQVRLSVQRNGSAAPMNTLAELSLFE